MNFSIPEDLLALQKKTRRFIAEEIIPMENDPRQSPHGPSAELRQVLIEKARAHGLLTPHASKKMGGLGLSHIEKAIVFEEAGYSPLGPVALNIHAPDEGNVHLMEVVATEAQKERWLVPMVQGLTRSCFAMSEPDGAGSDPQMLATTAVRDGDDYVINGHKWLITGAEGASVSIIMAKMEDGSATMFLTDTDRPGFIIERAMDSLDSCFAGGHQVLRFENLRIPATDILGEIGKGFRYAQIRLAPARLTHCMRWLGAAQRSHDIACDYARTRQSFGKPLGDHQGVGFMLADNEMDMHTTRLAIWHCADVLDGGGRGNVESSMTKVISSEAIWRVVDRCVQILGGRGVTGETIVERIFRDVRAFRIYDGPSEIHRMSLAKKIMLRSPEN
ncbi:acyl-CoA dehydrogenase family protein [Glaciimonas sp. CA11.2]|uniref:acyl-CoA dehydrogenase family protein n=1 Tax=unclassified Glaciimonas TaxID=2644401 RepID=UPI002AB5C86A|nr:MULTISPECIES: acyl-CoA dehydrogenase family protein [unclassified Glaciimonas]MDY7547009.1 acyl-CoA dehydrogenase family protein [Glaciimonas sp. CA11.2]MEB0011143.1 acyl-CoA dehydrogenase family protein [Glaciimonas sp. Cout2]MEB0081179.1 acyl-CoA dehydrogenase family protein [Glaciimonas sp. Gout2]MEB0162753.1 acyl-CoA dehydrogenase family protein [Glaciimonas sp. CA11.2]